jgi:hypothetical protein
MKMADGFGWGLEGQVHALFREWYQQGKMHNKYKFSYGEPHLLWLSEDDPNKKRKIIKMLLGPNGYTIYRALVKIREAKDE